MSTTTTNARRAVTAGLGLALALCGALGPARTALAEGGSITISQQNNEGATYDAFMLFRADISEDDHATHVSWASDEMKAAVLGFLDANGYGEWLSANHPGGDQHDRAQNAADYIAIEISGSETDSGAATTPRTTAALSFATELAQALANSPVAHETATSGETFTADEGYWLFVTTDGTTEDHGEAGTAPIWVPLGGSVDSVLEKSAAPTVDKEVREDSTGEWGKVADADTGQTLDYRLVGTLPTNFDAFELYHYKFTDTLEEGLTIDIPEGGGIADAISVTINGQKAAIDGENLKASYEGNVLVVEFADLKDGFWDGFGIDKDTTFTVEYPCHMNDGRAIGAPGNLNGVQLTYTDDPIWLGDGRTDEVDVRVFAYKLSLRKVDEQTDEPIEGAAFTIRVADDSSDEESRGLWVQADGSLGATAHEFRTGADGTFEVEGLDEGTYVISETAAPFGWDRIDEDIVLSVNSRLEGASLALSSLEATLTGGDAADVGAASITGVDAVDGDAGTITINATDNRLLEMPLTGMGGIGAAAAAGTAVALGAGVVLAVRRHSN